MTEDEARNKMCPMSFNTPDQLDILPCAASNCACWVWDMILQNPESLTNGLIRPHYEQSKTQGHCGLIK